MKLAVVTPRFGADIAGGAESAARRLSTELAARTEWRVDVLTTCARDAATWANDHSPGSSREDGLTVHRFPVTRARRRDFDRVTGRVVYRRRQVTADEQAAWVDDQGPVSPALLDAISGTDADVVAFHPYLYHPTVCGLPKVRERSVLHGAAHDEAPIRLPIYRELFLTTAALAYWSDAERHLTERLFPVAARRAVVLGLGVDAGDGSAAEARAALGLTDRPYLLCLGRVDDGKGARLLAACFAHYKERRPGPLALVFAGPVVDAPPAHPDIVVAGTVDEPMKWGLLRGAHALVSPSAYESFSMVLLEAWSVGRPALVNGWCAVTRDHALRSGAGVPFASYGDFEVALDRMVGDDALRARMGEAGRRYVAMRYRWDDLVARYAGFLGAVATRPATTDRFGDRK